MANATKSAPELINELKSLVIDYAKQETIRPLRSLGQYLGWGIAGSVMIALGGLFLTVGILRVLQTQTGGAFDGGWSFVPYLIVFVITVIVLGLLGTAVRRTKKTFMEQP